VNHTHRVVVRTLVEDLPVRFKFLASKLHNWNPTFRAINQWQWLTFDPALLLLPDDAADFIGVPAAQLPDMSSPPPAADGRLRRRPPSPPSASRRRPPDLGI